MCTVVEKDRIAFVLAQQCGQCICARLTVANSCSVCVWGGTCVLRSLFSHFGHHAGIGHNTSEHGMLVTCCDAAGFTQTGYKHTVTPAFEQNDCKLNQHQHLNAQPSINLTGWPFPCCWPSKPPQMQSWRGHARPLAPTRSLSPGRPPHTATPQQQPRRQRQRSCPR